jgi:hypothetical protein
VRQQVRRIIFRLSFVVIERTYDQHTVSLIDRFVLPSSNETKPEENRRVEIMQKTKQTIGDKRTTSFLVAIARPIFFYIRCSRLAIVIV